MKKILFLALYTAVCASCNRASVLEEPMPIPMRSSSVTEAPAVEVENGMLKFADEAAIERTLSVLLQLDETSLAAWYDSVGFVSQEMAREAALEEFQAMESLDEYPAFKAKYAGQFLFNDNLDEEDYQPYVAASRFAYEMILNADGNAIVGGQVVNYNYERFEETMYYRVSHASEGLQPRISPETKTNQVYGIVGKKKFWAWAVRMGTDVYMQVTAQKKNLFGWNDYKANYCITMRKIVTAEDPSQNVHIGEAYAFYGYGRNEPYWTGRISCNTKFLINRTKSIDALVTGAYSVYTSGTGEEGEGFLIISL